MGNNNHKKTVPICVVTRAPKDSTLRHLYGSFQMSVRVDLNTSKILSVAYTCPTHGCHEDLKDLLIGYSLDKGVKSAAMSINERISCPYKEVIYTALEKIEEDYKKIKKKMGNINNK